HRLPRGARIASTRPTPISHGVQEALALWLPLPPHCRQRPKRNGWPIVSALHAHRLRIGTDLNAHALAVLQGNLHAAALLLGRRDRPQSVEIESSTWCRSGTVVGHGHRREACERCRAFD